DAPEMKDWAEEAARTCERAYQLINEELKSDGYRPPTLVPLALKSGYAGIAMTSRGRITASGNYFQARPDGAGAWGRVTVCVVQNYQGRDNPRWLVEAVADYIRFFKFEPGRLEPPTPELARCTGGSQVAAAFLDYLTRKYDREVIRRLNAVM